MIKSYSPEIDPRLSCRRALFHGYKKKTDISPFNSPPNRLLGCETLGEDKTLARLDLSPDARAAQFQSDVEKRVHNLDDDFPGSNSSESSTLMVLMGSTWCWLMGLFQTFLGMLWFLLTSLHVFALFG
jgi:hypothetical protein